MPISRIARCLRWRLPGAKVGIMRSVKHASCSYTGLQVCGRVWLCPVCSAKIVEHRRSEIVQAMTAHSSLGGVLDLLTLTSPHQRNDDLVELLANQADALARFNSDLSVRKVFKEMGVIGQIRALEVTHGRKSPTGDNGWHPHYHVLLFAGHAGATAADLKAWQDRLYVRWARCCERSGLGTPSLQHGLKLDDGSRAAHYVSKWGLEDEMTRGHTKKAIHGETPFDLLRSLLADCQDRQAAVLFLEFARAFKGKRQLHWSAKLKERFGIGEVSDDEAATTNDKTHVLLGELEADDWRLILKHDARCQMLERAFAGGWPAVCEYLAELNRRSQTTRKEVS